MSKSLKSTLGALITILLTFLPVILLACMMESGEPGLFFGTFTYVFSGQLFSEGWNPVHAGFALDQPTIGKWYFWFTAFSVVWLPYMALVRRYLVRHSLLRQWIFAGGLTILCLFLVCLLTIPFWRLIRYIQEMGWTAKRLSGLVYAAGGYGIILWFWTSSFRFLKHFLMKTEAPRREPSEGVSEIEAW